MFSLVDLQNSPSDFLDPEAKIERIICHWTAGSYTVSDLDREHYHFIIPGTHPQTIHPGFYKPSGNNWTGHGKYAAHTYRLNTSSLGIAVACMAGANRHNFGRFPMTREQWLTMARLAGIAAKYYDLKITAATVLGHHEVQAVYGIDQGGKWDPGVLPWDPNISTNKVGTLLREEAFRAQRAYAESKNVTATKEKDPKAAIPPATVVFFDKKKEAVAGKIKGRIHSGSVMVLLKDLQPYLPVETKFISDGNIFTDKENRVWVGLASATVHYVPWRGRRGGIQLEWDNKTKTATVHF